jgi:hypothetical protein
MQQAKYGQKDENNDETWHKVAKEANAFSNDIKLSHTINFIV